MNDIEVFQPLQDSLEVVVHNHKIYRPYFLDFNEIDNQLLVTTAKGYAIYDYDLWLQIDFKNKNSMKKAAYLSRGSDTIITLNDYGQLEIDIPKTHQTQLIENNKVSYTCFSTLRDKGLIVAGTHNGAIHFINGGGETIKVLNLSDKKIKELDFENLNGAALNEEGKIFFIDGNTLSLINNAPSIIDEKASDLAVADNGKVVVSIIESFKYLNQLERGKLTFWDAKDGTLIKKDTTDYRGIFNINCIERDCIVDGFLASEIYRDFKHYKTYKNEGKSHYKSCFLPNKNKVLIGSAEQLAIAEIDVEKKKVSRILEQMNKRYSRISTLRNGNFLMLQMPTSLKHYTKVIDLSTNKFVNLPANLFLSSKTELYRQRYFFNFEYDLASPPNEGVPTRHGLVRLYDMENMNAPVKLDGLPLYNHFNSLGYSYPNLDVIDDKIVYRGEKTKLISLRDTSEVIYEKEEMYYPLTVKNHYTLTKGKTTSIYDKNFVEVLQLPEGLSVLKDSGRYVFFINRQKEIFKIDLQNHQSKKIASFSSNFWIQRLNVSEDGETYGILDKVSNTTSLKIFKIGNDELIKEIELGGDHYGLFFFGNNASIIGFHNDSKSNIEIWNIDTKKLLATLYLLKSSQQEYVIYTPDGRVDGTPNALKHLIHFEKNGEKVPIDLEKVQLPFLLKHALDGKI